MLRGTVKWFNNTKGYGFITYGDLEDIFVHYSAIRKDGYKTLKEGNVVDFKLIETAKGLQAVDVEEIQYATNWYKTTTNSSFFNSFCYNDGRKVIIWE